ARTPPDTRTPSGSRTASDSRKASEPPPPPVAEPTSSTASDRPSRADATVRAGEPAGGVADTEAPGELVRVSAERLDSLMSAVGELIIATGRVVERSGINDDDARRLDGATDHVAEVVRRLRLRPFSDVCEGLPRAVRDVAAAEGKEVALSIEAADAEADRMVIDALRDPLLHLVRNA